jgi:hypothetical protein
MSLEPVEVKTIMFQVLLYLLVARVVARLEPPLALALALLALNREPEVMEK